MSSISKNNKSITRKKTEPETLRTVIVVEDDEGLNRLILKTLKREGFPTKGVPTGSQAVKIAAENTDSILLLDYLLSDMTAEDVILALNEKKLRVPFIIMTGHGDEKIAIKLMKLGAMDYIIKEKGFLELLPTVLRRVFNELNTEQKLIEAQNALRESEKKYRSIFEAAANLIISINKEGIIVDCNRRIQQLLNYGQNEIIGQSIAKIIHSDYHTKSLECLMKIQAGESLHKQEYKMVRKDGILIDVNINSATLKNDNEEFVRTICIIDDITERKEMSKKLEWELTINTALADLSNALVISSFSISDIANIVLDYAKLITNSKHGYVSSIDPLTGNNISYGLTHMFGNQNKAFYTNSPFTYKSSGETLKKHIPFNNFLLVPAIFGKKLVGQIALANSDRDYKKLDLKVIERFADLYAIAIHRKQIEDELRKSEACLAEAQRIAKTGNYTWDTKKDELSWSQGTYLIFGVNPGEFKPDFKKYIDFIHPEDKRRVTEIFKKALIKKTKYNVEYRIMLKDGTERVLQDVGEVSCDEHNKPARMFGVVRDITERKNLETALFEIEERERQRIGYELHDGLGQLLTGISFKNRGLERKLEKSSLKEAEDVSEISMLIAEAKEQVGRLSKGLSPVEMDKEGLMAGLEMLAFHNEKMFGIPCVFRCDKPVSIHNKAAIIQLYRIAQEAVTNAVKHGRPNQIVISLAKKYSKISMSIKDDGIGISKNPDRTKGMGLKIMRHRAGIINASFDVRQNIDEGTLVTCIFSDNSKGKNFSGIPD